MSGVFGLILVVIGLVLLYDVLAGKSANIVGIFNGTVDTVASWTTKKGG